MYLFSSSSKQKLSSSHALLQFLFRTVIKFRDCTIIEGKRSEFKQNDLFDKGFSTLRFPDSKHNRSPSDAIDSGPYPLRWPPKLTPEQRTLVKQYARWYRFAGFVEGVAAVLGIPIRWGGDWDGDGELSDQSFDDLPHFEIDSRKLPNN